MSVRGEVSHTSAVVLHAYLWLAVGAGFEPPLRLLLGLSITMIAFVFGWRAAFLGRRSSVEAPSLTLVYASLAALAANGALGPSPSSTGGMWYEATVRGFGAVAVGLVALHAHGDARQRRIATWALVAPAVLFWLLAPLAEPDPHIDVWQLYQHGAHDLLHGHDPYNTLVPDAYGGRIDYGYRNPYFNYLPLSLLLSLPSYVAAGDYRFGLALALVATLGLLHATARRLGVSERLRQLVLVAAALHPVARMLVVKGWNEPYLALALAAFVYFQVRAPRGVAQAIALFAMPAMKQYVVAPVLLYPTLRPRVRSVALALGCAALTMIPFLLWDARSFLDQAILFQLHGTGFRSDGLTVSALLYRVSGAQLGKAWALGTQLVAAAAAWTLLRQRGLGGYLLASGLALWTSFLFGSQAFMNYYFLVGIFLLGAVLTLEEPG
jgi:hypothetical protein